MNWDNYYVNTIEEPAARDQGYVMLEMYERVGGNFKHVFGSFSPVPPHFSEILVLDWSSSTFSWM